MKGEGEKPEELTNVQPTAKEVVQNIQNSQQLPAPVKVVNSPAKPPRCASNRTSAQESESTSTPPTDQQPPLQQPVSTTEDLIEAMKTIHALEQAIEDLRAIEKKTSDFLERATKQLELQQSNDKSNTSGIYSPPMGSMDLHKLCLKHQGRNAEDDRIGSGYYSGGN